MKKLNVLTTKSNKKVVLAKDLYSFLSLTTDYDKWLKNCCKNLIEKKEYAETKNGVIFTHDTAFSIIDNYVDNLTKNIAYWSEEYQLATMKITKKTYSSMISLTQDNINKLKRHA